MAWNSERIFPGGAVVKESTHQCRAYRTQWFHPWVGKIPWRMKWQPTPVSLPGKSHGQRSLAGYSPWGCKELAMTECTHTEWWENGGFRHRRLVLSATHLLWALISLFLFV